MKKLFTLACGILLAAQFASAQTEMPHMLYHDQSGALQVVEIGDGGYMDFSDNTSWVVLSNDDAAPVVSKSSISATSKVEFAEGVTGIKNMEIGVCWSSSNGTPTVNDNCQILGSEAKEYSFKIENLELGTLYYCRLYAKIADSVTYSDVRSATPELIYEYIDLGLPSGNLWATVNLGVESGNAADSGNYYWFGTTDCTTEYCGGNPNYSYSDTLKDEDDPACILWGADWHTPSYADFEELSNYCTVELTECVNSAGETRTGYTFSNNGKSIFLPFSGEMEASEVQSLNSQGSYMINYCTGDTNGSKVAQFSKYSTSPDKCEISYQRGTTRAVKKIQ